MKTGAHHCDACGTKGRVTDMSNWDGNTMRIIECPCGERWESVEARGKRLQPATTRCNPLQPVATGANPLQPVTAGYNPLQPATTGTPSASAGGVGGGLPSGLVSGPSLPDLDPSLSVNPDRARERKRRVTETETAAFAAFYEAYPRKKARPDAWRAWVREGCEAIATAVMDGLSRAMPDLRSRPPDKVPYPASWLHRREFEDPAAPVGQLFTRQARSAGNVDALQRWLAKTDDKGAA